MTTVRLALTVQDARGGIELGESPKTNYLVMWCAITVANRIATGFDFH